jgi:hypothetical protein
MIGIRLSSMADVGAGILGLLSAGIFLAHALERIALNRREWPQKI